METLQRTANRGSISTGGYEIDNSLKLERANGEQVVTTNQAEGNYRTWTFSAWIKRTELSKDYHTIFGAEYTNIQIMDNNRPRLVLYDGSTSYYADPEMLMRDTSAWYHIVVALDSTQGTAADRVKWYINGDRVTDFNNSTYANMSQNTEFTGVGKPSAYGSGGWLRVGDFFGGSEGFSGYIADVYYLNGTAEDADAFGETDSDSGIWIPKEYTGSGYGTQGFHYKFDNASNLGEDSSGEGHDANSLGNITAADQSTDTPTNNFCTFLSDGTLFSTSSSDNPTFKQGGTEQIANGGTGWVFAYGTQAASSGKWYWEGKVSSTKNCMIGACPVDTTAGTTTAYLGQQSNGTIGFQYGDGNIFYWTGATEYVAGGGGVSTNDIIGFAMDLDNNKAYVSRNGTWLNSADPAGNSNGHAILDKPYMFAMARYNPSQNNYFNFGGFPSFTISSAATDENGYGTFEYAPPSGFYAMCTKNLAEYG